MAATASSTDPVAELDQFLASQATASARAQADDFDMNDEPDRVALAAVPRLHQALEWLGASVANRWQQADAAALVHQRRHSLLARTAIVTGTSAIILTVVQLALTLSWPEFTGAMLWLEAVIVLGGVVSVIVGLLAKADHNWLGQRHLAERLRMLKFRALAHPNLWNGNTDEWKAWVRDQIQELQGAEALKRVEAWASEDRSEPAQLVADDGAKDPEMSAALATYYCHKRLNYQGHYFRRKGTAAKHQVSWQRNLRLPLFFVMIGCVLFHFAAHWLAGQMDRAGDREAARIWELFSLWGVVLAAALPVLGIGVRAWTAAFEHARKARSFAAKHVAMQDAVARLMSDQHDLAAVLGHMQHDELFLEQEHREWLRLLLDAEWFL
jgi:hypothetical protein